MPQRSFPRRLTASFASVLFVLMGTGLAGAESTSAFVKGVWAEAKAEGVSRTVFDAAFADYAPSQKIMELTRKQPEFTSTVGQYIGKRVTAALAERGRGMAAEWRKTLAAIEKRYGVDAEAVLAIWGMETNFGGYVGGTNTVHALATLTHGGYRSSYFRKELLTALRILEAGHVKPQAMIGSWAGAMGQTQFMPTSFVNFAVDHNGDGRADIWNSVPDALASTANYLKEHGWRPGETWGYEVSLPRGFDFERARQMDRASLGEWQALGVTRASGKPFPRQTDMARIYMPAGGHGPVFLLLPNFEAIKSYNKSDSYALAVGHLADRIIGGGGFINPFPADDVRLSETQRRELQAQLARRGFDVGTPDGVIGPKTRAAIIAFQRTAGLLADGHPSIRVLNAL